MAFEKAYIPYGGYWSTPFVKWQGKFATLHPLKFASEVARRALQEREIATAGCASGVAASRALPCSTRVLLPPGSGARLAVNGPPVHDRRSEPQFKHRSVRVR